MMICDNLILVHSILYRLENAFPRRFPLKDFILLCTHIKNFQYRIEKILDYAISAFLFQLFKSLISSCPSKAFFYLLAHELQRR